MRPFYAILAIVLLCLFGLVGCVKKSEFVERPVDFGEWATTPHDSTITFIITDTCQLLILARDNRGDIVDTIIDSLRLPGQYTQVLKLSPDLPDGAYSIMLSCGDLILTKIVRKDSYITNGTYPNPFSPSTIISYNLAKSCPVLLVIFSVQGQFVDTLVNQVQDAGPHKVVVAEHAQLESGMYFYKLTGCDSSVTKKLLLIK